MAGGPQATKKDQINSLDASILKEIELSSNFTSNWNEYSEKYFHSLSKTALQQLV